jgi:hypothetical protein
MLLRHFVAISLFAVSTAVLADTIDINLRDTSAQLQYKSSLGRDTLGKTEFHAGFLYAKKDDLMGDFGLLVKDEVGSKAPGFSVGVGIKGIVASVRGNNPSTSTASALTLGGLVRYSPPSIPQLSYVGLVYLSPNIITFGDAERYIEVGARVEYEVIPQAVIYLGYRRISFILKTLPDAVLDSGPHIGVRLSF